MKGKVSRITALVMSAVVSLSACLQLNAATITTDAVDTANSIESAEGITISSENISVENYKNEKYNNPISSEFFCADPTSVEYNGRLYLIGTNDHEQFEIKGPDLDNTYEQIKSFVVLSTDDMVNWIYHGEINVDEVAPWITNSWAPSIVSRVEDDGLTHFYLYFSNNGLGTGVITATNPLGPWSDPLGKPLISSNTAGLTDCPNPFDPGAVIDENGVGWLSFGGGKASDGTDYMPGSSRIVRLGDDMISFASDFAEIPAPYFFEASELNYINGTYIYTYNSDWSDHSAQWDYDCPAPTACSMVYMTTKTPLDPNSWVMKGEYFKNPGISGFDYSNNHTHLHKFQEQYYIFYHTLMLKGGMGIKGAYRSLNVDTINVDESTVTIEVTGGTKKGVSSIKSVNPFEEQSAANLNNTAEISFDTSNNRSPIVISDTQGSWISVRDVIFTESEESDEPEAEIILEQMAVDTIQYNIEVTSVSESTELFMHPATKSGVDCDGSVQVTGVGNYTITCNMGGAEQLMNIGYFTVSNDASITFVVKSITVNGKYEFDLSTELTNTRDWADGLKNIWNGFNDGDVVYTSDYAEFRYNGADDAIVFYASAITDTGNSDNAPLVEEPMTFYGNVKGSGRLEVRIDSPTGEILTSIDFNSPTEFTTIYSNNVSAIGGTHDLYFVFSNADIEFDSWLFEKQSQTIVYGDVNGDGKINAMDATITARHAVGSITLSDDALVSADVNGDGKINAFDATFIARYAIGTIEKFPIES